MKASDLLQWHYMIFLLPLSVSALLLLLSSLRLGHHRGGHAVRGQHGGGPHAIHRGGASHGPKGGHTAHRASQSAKSASGQKTKTDANKERPNISVTTNFVWNLTGLNRAPLPMVLEAFLLAWGLCGYWANRMLLHESAPEPGKVLPSLGVALIGGLIGARLAAEVIGRMLPEDETLAVSRNTLFGLCGTVAYPISETNGRIHVYDAFGTLHDETCRVASGHPAIAKGRRVMVVDIDSRGHLIVEEVSDPAP